MYIVFTSIVKLEHLSKLILQIDCYQRIPHFSLHTQYQKPHVYALYCSCFLIFKKISDRSLIFKNINMNLEVRGTRVIHVIHCGIRQVLSHHIYCVYYNIFDN